MPSGLPAMLSHVIYRNADSRKITQQMHDNRRESCQIIDPCSNVTILFAEPLQEDQLRRQRQKQL